MNQANAVQQPQHEPQEIAAGGIQLLLNTFFRALVLVSIFQLLMQYTGMTPPTPTPTPTPTIQPNETKIKPTINNLNPKCIWNQGTSMDLSIYITEETPEEYTRQQQHKNKKTILKKKAIVSYTESNLILDPSSSDNRNASLSIPISHNLLQNKTNLYAHLFLTKRKGKDIENMLVPYNELYKIYNLTRFKLRKKKKKVKNLLQQNELDEKDEEKENFKSILGQASINESIDAILLYIKPFINLQLVQLDDKTPLPISSLPSFLAEHFMFVDPSNTSFYPLLHPSEFWLKSDSLIIVNDTLTNVTIDISLSHVGLWKWQLMTQMEYQWKTQAKAASFGGLLDEEEDDSQADFLRTILYDTNPYLLAVTFIVSMLHTVFDMLAFKNDISFHKKRKSMEGLSLKSMIVNAFFQIIIFLYLLDNDTNFMVLASNGVSVLIEFWKISRSIKVSWEGGKIQWEESSTYSLSKTKEYDEIATSHLMYVTMPLVIGYGVYSLVHLEHKGWYSWLIGTLVGFIYMFGFVMMTPQLFINYKLKSVAHLNWRTMSYKALNTFIDDLFAFVIRMPIMHRLACLRDDIIFVIFLYQRYIYKIDYSRVNEFGQGGDDTTTVEEEKKGKKRRGAREKLE